jgi:hypothetical protein
MYPTLENSTSSQATMSLSQAKFSPGQVVATPGSLAAMNEHGCLPQTLLSRHLAGDWGQVGEDDAELNDHAFEYGDRLLSSYVISPRVTIWLITEWDRSVTTFLLPSEY